MRANVSFAMMDSEVYHICIHGQLTLVVIECLCHVRGISLHYQLQWQPRAMLGREISRFPYIDRLAS